VSYVERSLQRDYTHSMHQDILAYHAKLAPADRAICETLAKHLQKGLPEAEVKIWHAHPVWFLAGNPIVGYHKLKDGVRLLFWSGQSFAEEGLRAEGSFKAAEVRYHKAAEVKAGDLARWLKKARDIQWDYKNIVKRKGILKRVMATSTAKPHRIYAMVFAQVYPMYVAKAERKGRTQAEVDQIIRWLTGYTPAKLKQQLTREVTLEQFFAEAPRLNPARTLITGSVCGVRLADITDPLMREVRYLDKLIDELAQGKAMAKILRK
jgi:hypothetical protein